MHRRTFLGLATALPFAERLRRLLPAAPVKTPTAMATFYAGLQEGWNVAMWETHGWRKSLDGNFYFVSELYAAPQGIGARLESDPLPQ